jgi:pyrroloquinoline-quinone synthase
MTIITLAKGKQMSFFNCMEKLLKDISYQNNVYFNSLHQGMFEKEEFIETQIQFFSILTFSKEPRLAFLEKSCQLGLDESSLSSIWNEEGQSFFHSRHCDSFLQFLSFLGGVDSMNLEFKTLWPEVRIFNTAILGACVLDRVWVGFGLMSALERVAAQLFPSIVNAIIKKNWILFEQLNYYSPKKFNDDLLKKALADLDSKDFSDIDLYDWEQGVRMGAVLVDQLYSDLYRGRFRRWSKNVAGPHFRLELAKN